MNEISAVLAREITHPSETFDEERESELIIDEIKEPFDPAKIRINAHQYSIKLLMDRLENDEIDLMPDFQRQGGLWTDKAMSQLIESLLIRIPLPAFYFDGSDESRWLVVDGLQRLTTLKRFIQTQDLRLQGLEFLGELRDKTFSNLARPLQRRILETQVTVYVIQEGTPTEVKFNVFKRINTGGLPLSSQEIRHALFQGEMTKLLKSLVQSQTFIEATGGSLRDDRMQARECILRAMAFLRHSPADYRTRDLDGFLNALMQELNLRENDVLRNRLAAQFLEAVEFCNRALFGHEAFRKIFREGTRRGPINRALLEAWVSATNTMSKSQRELLSKRRDDLRIRFLDLIDDPVFYQSISFSTGSPGNVRTRFEAIHRIIRETIT